MKLEKLVEVELKLPEVEAAVLEACSFDKLSLMIRMAKTITAKDIADIKDFLGNDNFQRSIAPLKELNNHLTEGEK